MSICLHLAPRSIMCVNMHPYPTAQHLHTLIMLHVSVDFLSPFVFYSGTVAARNRFNCLRIYWAA